MNVCVADMWMGYYCANVCENGQNYAQTLSHTHTYMSLCINKYKWDHVLLLFLSVVVPWYGLQTDVTEYAMMLT